MDATQGWLSGDIASSENSYQNDSKNDYKNDCKKRLSKRFGKHNCINESASHNVSQSLLNPPQTTITKRKHPHQHNQSISYD